MMDFRAACTAMLLMLLALHARAQAYVIGQVRVNSALNCHAGPSSHSRLQGAFTSNWKVKIYGAQGGWYHVECPNGRAGWVAGNFVSVAPTSAPASAPASVPASAPTAKPQVTLVSQTLSNSAAPGSCREGHTATKVTYYMLPRLVKFDKYKCQMEGSCVYQKNGVDMLYNYGRDVVPVSAASCPYGYGAGGKCISPCKTVAADLNYHRVGEVLYFPNLKGRLCQGQVMDGFVQVGDSGGAIKGADRFDFYWGECSNTYGDTCHDSTIKGDPNQISAALTGSRYYYCANGAPPTELVAEIPEATAQ